jgi:hypothetical protein
MDADDTCHHERLSRQLSLLDEAPQVALVSCLVRCFPAARVAGGMRRYEAWLNSLVEPADIAREIFVESPLCHPSVVMRRAAYELAGGYRESDYPEDYDLWLRFHRERLVMAKVPEVLFYWRERGDRLTRTDPRYGKDRFAALKLAYLLDGPLAGRTELTIWGAGPTGRGWRRRLVEAGLRIAAFIDIDPRKIGRARRDRIPVLSPKDSDRRGIPGGYMVVAVGAPGARGEIRDFLARRGFADPADFLFLA